MNTSTLRRNHTVKLADLIPDVKPGFAVGERDSDGVIQVRMNNVDLEGNLDLDGVIRVPATSKQISDCSLKAGDVLFNNTNSTELVGKSALFRGHSEPVTFSNHFTRLRVNQQRLEPRYLACWLTRQQKHRVFEGLCTRWVGQSAVRTEKLLALEIPLPPLPEQKRIADILDKADAIRRKRREAIELLDRVIQSTFLSAFGDPVSNSRKWELIPLCQYGRITTGNTPPRDDPDNYGDAIEWIKSDNINTPSHYVTRASEGLSEKGLSLARTATNGSTLITCIAGSRDCVGNAALTDRTVAFNQQINAITPGPQVDPHFLYALVLLSKPLVQRASTDSMKGMVSKGKLEQVQVIDVPPEAQSHYGCRFRQLLSSLENYFSAVGLASDLFNSLVQRAFRGEL
jgi:type I restriction enzyme S subunit